MFKITTLTTIFKSLSLVLFVYSGALKGILSFLPFDLTVFSGILCLSIMLIHFRIKKFVLKTTFIFNASVFFFFSWIGISCFYTSSENYYVIKFFQSLLLLICLFYPIIMFNTKKDLSILYYVFSSFSLIILSIFWYIYILDGSLNIYFITLSQIVADASNIKIPDYLIISEILALFILFNNRKNTLLIIILKILSFLMIIMLGGRGPLLFLILSILFYFILYFKFTAKSIIKIVLILTVIMTIGINYFFEWEGSKVLLERILVISEDEGGASLQARKDFLQKSLDMIADNPILGIGYGAWGKAAFGKDGNDHPHNFFIEIFCELGIVGFLLVIIMIGIFIKKFVFYLLKERKDKILIEPVMFFLFIFLNAMKSSSLIDLRSLFASIGLVIAAAMIKSIKREQ